MNNMSEEVHINDTLVWGYKRGGSYVKCSHLRVVVCGEVRSWMDHACWTTGREFVELNYERGGSSSWTTSRQVRGSIGILKTSLSVYLA